VKREFISKRRSHSYQEEEFNLKEKKNHSQVKDSCSNQNFSFKRKTFKINTFSSKREKIRLKIPSEENKHTKTFPLPQISTFQVKTFSFNEKETSKDLVRREQAYKCVIDTKRLNLQVLTFPFNEKETSDSHRKREQAHKSCPHPEDQISKSKIKTFKSKIDL